jgi:hypothetical protein
MIRTNIIVQSTPTSPRWSLPFSFSTKILYEFLTSQYVPSYDQGRIKGFVETRHFSSLGPFGDSKSIVLTTVYSRLSELMEGMHG